MQEMNYLKMLVDEFHSTVVATLDQRKRQMVSASLQ